MNRASVEGALRFDPPISGTMAWSADDRTLTLIHSEPFARLRYTATLTGDALDADGGSIDGDFDGKREASPADDYVWTFDFQLSNDTLAGATVIARSEGSVTGNNRRASDEFEDPSFVAGILVDANLWYQWSPPTNGWYTFDLTQGTSFNTLLAAYRGTNATQLTELAANDNSGSRLPSRLSFPAEAAAPYSILVGGNMTESVLAGVGNFNLRWYPTPLPAITSFIPQNAVPGRSVTFLGTDFTGTTRVTLNGNSLPFTGPTNANQLDLRLIVTLPTDARSGTFTVETPHGNATSVNPLTIIEAPSLALDVRVDGSVILSWPEQATGYVLQVSDRRGPNATWRPLFLPEASPPEPGRIRVIETPSQTVRYYRLRQP